MKLKTLLFAIICLASFASVVSADELFDYTENLTKEFSQSKRLKAVHVAARPRLLEVQFTKFLIEEFSKKQSKKQIVAKWKPIQKETLEQGYAFYVDFNLLNRNLDSGIDIQLGKSLLQYFTLENNLGDVAVMYKYEGGKNTNLNFMQPEMKMTCLFNTKSDNGKAVLRKGVTSLTLKISQISDAIPEMKFSWGVPLNYFSVKRPARMKAMFGMRPLRSLRGYKKHVYIKNDTPKINKVKRIKKNTDHE